MPRVLFVCLGNICRSPTAEATMRRLVEQEGLADEIEVASAGTGSWHVGQPPDERSTTAAKLRGIELTGQARQVTPADFDDWDLLVAMDSENEGELLRLAPDEGARDKVRKLGTGDVPDPYYGGDDGFERVLDIVDDGCRVLLDELRPAPR